MSFFSGSGGGLFGSKSGGFDLADPGGFGAGNPKLNPLRRAAVDPVGAFYQPPEELPSAEKLAREEEERKSALRDQINRAFGIGDDSAKAQLDNETKTVSDATRAYYTDQLNRAFPKAERDARFNLARQGLLGGSVDVDTNTELSTDKNLGATRIDEAVRKAAAGLTSQREQERLQGINLVNAGVGDSAVDSSIAGLRGAFTNANNASRADLFGDLFSASADTAAASNANQTQAALLARYQNQLKTFFPNNASSGGGRVTSSS